MLMGVPWSHEGFFYFSSIFIINNIICGYVTVTIRNAAAGDILPIKRILSQYILETELVEDNLDQFIVAEEGSRIVGCACLDITPGVVEIRSIAVFPGW